MNNRALSVNGVDRCFAGAAMERIAKKIPRGIDGCAQGSTYPC